MSLENLDTCSICLEDIIHNVVTNTGYCECKVKYHNECLLLIQLKGNIMCPICRITKKTNIDYDSCEPKKGGLIHPALSIPDLRIRNEITIKSSLRYINIPHHKESKLTTARKLHPSSANLYCNVNTPE